MLELIRNKPRSGGKNFQTVFSFHPVEESQEILSSFSPPELSLHSTVPERQETDTVQLKDLQTSRGNPFFTTLYLGSPSYLHPVRLFSFLLLAVLLLHVPQNEIYSCFYGFSLVSRPSFLSFPSSFLLSFFSPFLCLGEKAFQRMGARQKLSKTDFERPVLPRREVLLPSLDTHEVYVHRA